MANHPNRTWRWTQDNTQGFTDAQLDLINQAISIIRPQSLGVDKSNINDAINNAWSDQDDAETLAADTLKQFGR